MKAKHTSRILKILNIVGGVFVALLLAGLIPLGIYVSQKDKLPDKVPNPPCEYVEYRINRAASGHICTRTAKAWGLVPHPKTEMWVTPESLEKENPRMHDDPEDAVVPHYSGPRGRNPGDCNEGRCGP